MTHNSGLRLAGASHERTSMRLVEALAAAQHVSPTDLDVPLYRIVDPEALDRLFERNPATDFRVSFVHADHEVEIRSGGRISIDGVEYDPGDEPEKNYG